MVVAHTKGMVIGVWRYILPIIGFVFQLLGGAELIGGVLGGREKVLEVIPVIAQAFLPHLGIALSVGALLGLWLTGKSWDRKQADEIIEDLEQFIKAGHECFKYALISIKHPSYSHDFNIIGQKYFKWLATEKDGVRRLTWQSVDRATRFKSLLRTHGYFKARLGMRRFIAKNKQNP